MSQAGQYSEGLSLSEVKTLTGNSGGAIGANGIGNIGLVGTGDVTVSGAGNTLTIMLSDEIPAQFDTDSGSAIPSGSILNILGSHGLNTTGAGNTVTVLIDNDITLGDLSVIAAGSPAITLTTGDLDFTTGSINFPTTTATAGVVFTSSNRFLHSFGTQNTFLGNNSGNFTLTGIQNVGVGNSALVVTSSGDRKVAIGHNAMASVTTGASDSIAIGFQSMNGVTTAGTQSIGIGTNCFSNAYAGTGCVAVGYQALDSCTSSDNCIAIGSNALGGLTGGGDNNIAVGNAAGSVYTTESNNITIGSTGTGTDSGVIRLGTNATHTSCFITGIDGVNVGNVADVVTMNGDELGTATLTAGTNITITPTANTITINAATEAQLTITALDNTDSPYTVLAADQVLACNTTAGILSVLLPNAPTTGRVIYTKDAAGTADTNNITLTTVGGTVTIDGATTLVMNTEYQSVTVVFDGTNYLVI